MNKKIVTIAVVLAVIIGLAFIGLNAFKGKIKPKEKEVEVAKDADAGTGLKPVPATQAPKEKSKAEFEFEKAQSLYNEGKFDEAIAGFENVLKLDEKFASAHTEISIIYMEKEQWDGAIKELKKSLEIEPNSPKAHYALAVNFARKPEPDAKLARFHFEKSKELGFIAPAWFEDFLKRLEAGKQ